MLTRFFLAIVAGLFASQLLADVRQPLSVKPIKSSVSALYSGEDILARKYNPVEHQWRVARLPEPYRQQNQEIPTDYLDQLNSLEADDEASNQPGDLKPVPLDHSSQNVPMEQSKTLPGSGSITDQPMVEGTPHGWHAPCQLGGSGPLNSCTSCSPSCTWSRH